MTSKLNIETYLAKGRRRKKRETFEPGSGSCRDVAKESWNLKLTIRPSSLIHCLRHTQKQGKIKFEPAIKLHHDNFFCPGLYAVLSLVLACLAFLEVRYTDVSIFPQILGQAAHDNAPIPENKRQYCFSRPLKL